MKIPNRDTVEQIKKKYPPGTRIQSKNLGTRLFQILMVDAATDRTPAAFFNDSSMDAAALS